MVKTKFSSFFKLKEGGKKITISSFKREVYIHILDNNKNRTITFNINEYNELIEKTPRILKRIGKAKSWIEKYDPEPVDNKGSESDSSMGSST